MRGSVPDPPVPGQVEGSLAGLLLAVDHVGVAVPDLDAAIGFYRDVLGLRVVHEETNEEQAVREAMLEAGPGGGAQVQLLAPLSPDSPVGRFLDRSGPGLQQLAYRVSDVAAASALLRAQGLRVLDETPRRGTAGSLVAFVHPKDTGGVLIELVQPAADGDG